MGDVASPNALYPSAPQPNQGLLSGDPSKAVGLMNALNENRLFNSTFDARSQLPQAALTGQNISNQTALQSQQEAASKAIYRIIGGYTAGTKGTPDDIRAGVALAARSLPDIATKYPQLLTAASEAAQKNPGLLINSGLSPESQSSRVDVTEPNSGATYSVPVTSANMGSKALQRSLASGGAESAQAMQEDLRREGTYQSDVNPLKKALDLAQKLGPGGMAPGSKGRQEFESFVYGLAPSLVPAGMQDKIKNYAELEKYLVNNASQRAQNLGPHTNEGLATATTGSPNVHINDLAGVDLIKAQLAIRNMEHAQVLQAAKAGGPNYTTAKASFSSQHDPRAYAIGTMTPDEIRNLDKTLKPSERAKFNKSYQAAIESGILNKPGQ